MSSLHTTRPYSAAHSSCKRLKVALHSWNSHPSARADRRCITRVQQKPQGSSGDGGDPSSFTQDFAALENNPVLHDFLFGQGSSETPFERPEDAPESLSNPQIIDALQMGSWRLRSKVCPQIEALVAQVEGAWRSLLRDDLALYPLNPRFKYLDSIDPEGKQKMTYMSPDPFDKDDPFFPRLQIENRAYMSYAFRKLHAEVAVRQDGLQVFHCVMYPKPEFDLPILSLDVVGNADRITFAIIDPCPVSPDMSVPNIYRQPILDMQDKYGVASNRGIPEWGKSIFSEFCVIMRPTTGQEVASFLKYAIELTNFHVHIGKLAAPISATTCSNPRSRIATVRAAHEKYSAMQLQNDKTRRVLEKAFGEELTEEYMSTVMFDVPPSPILP